MIFGDHFKIIGLLKRFGKSQKSSCFGRCE
jgi:hypothetical protein